MPGQNAEVIDRLHELYEELGGYLREDDDTGFFYIDRDIYPDEILDMQEKLREIMEAL